MLWLFFIIPFLIAASYALLVIYTTNPDWLDRCYTTLECDLGDLPVARFAEFGDSFGVLTSVFSGLAFTAAWYLIRQHKKEMEALKSQLEKQDKNAFTQMLVSQWSRTIADAQQRIVEARKSLKKGDFMPPSRAWDLALNKTDKARILERRETYNLELEQISQLVLYPELLRVFNVSSSVNIDLLKTLISSDLEHNKLVADAVKQQLLLCRRRFRKEQLPSGEKELEVLKFFGVRPNRRSKEPVQAAR